MSYADDAATLLAPSDDAAFPNKDDRLANTGTTEDHNATALDTGRYASLVCGETPIRYSLRGATGAAAQVATTSRILGPFAVFEWYVTDKTCVVYVEAADGASAYEAWVSNT